MNDDVGGPTTELYVSKAWVYDHIRRALSEALNVRIEHFSIGFSYKGSQGAGIGALASHPDALRELDPVKIHDTVTAERIRTGETLVKPPPLTLVKP